MLSECQQFDSPAFKECRYGANNKHLLVAWSSKTTTTKSCWQTSACFDLRDSLVSVSSHTTRECEKLKRMQPQGTVPETQCTNGKCTLCRQRLSNVFCYFPGNQLWRENSIFTTEGSRRQRLSLSCCMFKYAQIISDLTALWKLPVFAYHAHFCPVCICHLSQGRGVSMKLDFNGVVWSLPRLFLDKVRGRV